MNASTLFLIGGSLLALSTISDVLVLNAGSPDEHLRLRLERGKDFSKDELPAIGSAPPSQRVLRWVTSVGYVLSMLALTAGSAMYFGVV